MNTPLGALVTAGLLGVTHAIEPDHVAGISSLTGGYGDSRVSALAGACFSLGHVVLVVAWLVVGYVLLEQTSFAPALDAVGSLGVALLLGLSGAAMAVGGLRGVVRVHDHVDTHGHTHGPLPFVWPFRSVVGLDRRRSSDSTRHDHDRVPGRYLAISAVGALFTLSPPASMIAFTATLFPVYGPAAVASAVLVYAVAITVTMSALGGGVGAVFGTLEPDRRTYALARVIAGVLVTGVAASVFLDAIAVLG